MTDRCGGWDGVRIHTCRNPIPPSPCKSRSATLKKDAVAGPDGRNYSRVRIIIKNKKIKTQDNRIRSPAARLIAVQRLQKSALATKDRAAIVARSASRRGGRGLEEREREKKKKIPSISVSFFIWFVWRRWPVIADKTVDGRQRCKCNQYAVCRARCRSCTVSTLASISTPIRRPPFLVLVFFFIFIFYMP